MSDARNVLTKAVLAALLAALPLATAGCPAPDVASGGEGLDVNTLPESVRPDYAVFAQRCSKCHSLSRPLQSGITNDDYWVDYVARMRRQPASGISLDDTVVILRFLHYYSIEQKKKGGG